MTYTFMSGLQVLSAVDTSQLFGEPNVKAFEL